ncbi:MAG: hypothetical protein ACJAVY_001002 [Marinoscillum sp.]|jgi:hypothetical protein
MPKQKKNINKGTAKTLLIILGVVVALLLTLNAPLFTALNLSVNSTSNLAKNQKEILPLPEAKDASSGMNYNSGTRILHIFTENLPYLNNK